MMFGRPGSVMGSMTFRDFYDQTYGILLARHGEKILTAETLAARQGFRWR